jgi:NADH:ubiquinone oxidoreductase subunit 5 (subunit L)/multisubunit Na+/H+ antiporter MnhA subunit
MRFAHVIYIDPQIVQILLLASIYTTLYAGLNALVETDFKKLIALSTLRHLGFISIAFSLGITQLAFFHLLTHALFKRLLFFCIGVFMVYIKHNQDTRLMGLGEKFRPMTRNLLCISLFNLFGLPALSGFLSKDLILEATNLAYLGWVLLAVVYLNVLLTYLYTIKLFMLRQTNTYYVPNTQGGLIQNSRIAIDKKLVWLLVGLAIIRCVFGRLVVGTLDLNSRFLINANVSFIKKVFPLIVLRSVLSVLFSSKYFKVFPTVKVPFLINLGGRILLLRRLLTA